MVKVEIVRLLFRLVLMTTKTIMITTAAEVTAKGNL